jgi:hypothetical protein
MHGGSGTCLSGQAQRLSSTHLAKPRHLARHREGFAATLKAQELAMHVCILECKVYLRKMLTVCTFQRSSGGTLACERRFEKCLWHCYCLPAKSTCISLQPLQSYSFKIFALLEPDLLHFVATFAKKCGIRGGKGRFVLQVRHQDPGLCDLRTLLKSLYMAAYDAGWVLLCCCTSASVAQAGVCGFACRLMSCSGTCAYFRH